MTERAEKEMEEIQIPTVLAEESADSEENIQRMDTMSENRAESHQDNAEADTRNQTESVDRCGPLDTPATTQTSTPDVKTSEAILTPQIKFTKASKPDAVIIMEDGMTVKDKPGESAGATTVGTDALISQSHYWEVAVSWRMFSSLPEPDSSAVVCTTGVILEGSEFSSRPGLYDSTYGVDIGYFHETNSYRFDCTHLLKCEASSKEVFLKDEAATNHFGFLLQPLERTLSVIDLGTETRLHTFRELNVSRPYEPVVWFGAGFFHRSVSLLSGDHTIPLRRALDIVNS